MTMSLSMLGRDRGKGGELCTAIPSRARTGPRKSRRVSQVVQRWLLRPAASPRGGRTTGTSCRPFAHEAIHRSKSGAEGAGQEARQARRESQGRWSRPMGSRGDGESRAVPRLLLKFAASLYEGSSIGMGSRLRLKPTTGPSYSGLLACCYCCHVPGLSHLSPVRLRGVTRPYREELSG